MNGSYHSSIRQALADVAELLVREELVLGLDELSKLVPREHLQGRSSKEG